MLLATAEYEAVVKIGGLGEAAHGLARALRDLGIDVEVVLPDYGNLPVMSASHERTMSVPEWAQPATVRQVRTASGEPLTAVTGRGVGASHQTCGPAWWPT